MNRNIAIFAFNGELMCFAHALLNAVDLYERGNDVRLIIEGSATKLIPQLMEPKSPFHALFVKTKEKKIIDCVCKACASKMGVLDKVIELGLPLGEDLQGHPSMAQYLLRDYEIITV